MYQEMIHHPNIESINFDGSDPGNFCGSLTPYGDSEFKGAYTWSHYVDKPSSIQFCEGDLSGPSAVRYMIHELSLVLPTLLPRSLQYRTDTSLP